jgi:D-amino peptidase
MAMKIYILADMEGISGIRKIEQVQPGGSEYWAEGVPLMEADIEAAVAGCRAGGATEVIVADTHASGGQLRLSKMGDAAVYEMPGPDPAPQCMMPGLDDTFAGLILLGHHGMAGTVNGFLDHSFDSSRVFEMRLNGRPIGEIGIEAAYAGHFNVPVIMVSGDEAAAVEARDFLGDVECAVVKWGVGRNRARCLPVGQARELIRAAARRAVQRAATKDAFKPYKPDLPATLEVTYYRSDYAEQAMFERWWQRIDARTVRREVTSLRDVK